MMSLRIDFTEVQNLWERVGRSSEQFSFTQLERYGQILDPPVPGPIFSLNWTVLRHLFGNFLTNFVGRGKEQFSFIQLEHRSRHPDLSENCRFTFCKAETPFM